MSKHLHSRIEVLRDSFPDRPEMGPSLSRVLMDEVASGDRPATIRLSRPGRVVAFGRRDTVSPGYEAAVSAARRGGFEAMERLAGGRAAAYSEGTISLTMTTPEEHPARRTNQRFELVADLVASALIDLGIDARIGEVPGEYCPGAFSVNAGGRVKLAGIAQRMIKGAAHVGVVLVVSGSGLIRETLEPVYGALELDWDPLSTGAVEDETGALARSDAMAGENGLTMEAVDDALLERLASVFELEGVDLDSGTLHLAEEKAPNFRSPRTDS